MLGTSSMGNPAIVTFGALSMHGPATGASQIRSQSGGRAAKTTVTRQGAGRYSIKLRFPDALRRRPNRIAVTCPYIAQGIAASHVARAAASGRAFAPCAGGSSRPPASVVRMPATRAAGRYRT